MKRSGLNKSGMSLMEMIIAIAVFMIGIAGFTMLFSKTWEGNSYTYELGKASLAANQGLSKAVNYIRKARQGDDGSHPIKSASDNDLVLFSDYDKDGITERLHFYKNGSQFIMGYRRPSGGLPKTYAVGDEASLIVADNVVNEANIPIFYYYNSDYPGDTANNPINTPANVWDVRLIKVLLKINVLKGMDSDNVEASSFVEIRNLSDYDRIGS